jgi:hypothetical protein
MLPDSLLIFDCEIICGPLGEDEQPIPGIEYAKSWKDFKSMGISVIGTFSTMFGELDYFDGEFLDTDFDWLLKRHEHIVGFNSRRFDDLLLTSCFSVFRDRPTITTYDLLEECRRAAGQPLDYVKGVTKTGFSLNDLSKVNLGPAKTGNGALAPVLWQQGRKQEVIDYCLSDVALTKSLLEKGLTEGLILPGMDEPVKLREMI